MTTLISYEHKQPGPRLRIDYDTVKATYYVDDVMVSREVYLDVVATLELVKQ